MTTNVREWFEQRSFRHEDFAALGTAGQAPRELSTTLIFPARNVAATIGPILAEVARLNDRTGLIDQVMVVNADSTDGTADIARAWGAEVYSENELLPDYGRAQGKGDAMWRSLSAARGDVVMFADADTSNFREHFVYGTLGPLLTMPDVQFTKAAYRRPYTDASQSVADGGGRVTELMAKPLFNFFCPELTGFVQPLAGEFAAYRDLLCGVPFLTGYGVELGVMVDVLEEGRPRRDGPGRSRGAAEPASAVVGPQPDELGRAARDGQPGVAAAAGGLCPWPPRGADTEPARGVPSRGGHRLRAAAGRAP